MNRVTNWIFKPFSEEIRKAINESLPPSNSAYSKVNKAHAGRIIELEEIMKNLEDMIKEKNALIKDIADQAAKECSDCEYKKEKAK